MEKKIVPLIIVIFFAVASVWPVFKNLGTVGDFGTDGELIVWITNQTIQKVTGNFREFERGNFSIWSGNIFYPYNNILGYSDLFMISALWAIIPVIVTGNPAVTAGVGLLVGQILTMIISYFWFKEMSLNRWAAAVSAVAFGWAQVRWHYQVHLQMWNMQYFLGSAFCFWKFIKTNNFKWGIGGGILLGLQAWESLLPVYFGLSTTLIILISNNKFLMIKKFQYLKRVFMVALTAITIMLPVILLYAGVSREFGVERSIREVAHNGLSVDDTWGWFGSIGIIALLILAIIQITNHKLQETNKDLKWLVGLAIFGYVMALGPTLKWGGQTVKLGNMPIPLPYVAAYYTVPGFKALRTPSRWIWLTGFAVSGMVAIGLSTSPLRRRNNSPLHPSLKLREGNFGDLFKKGLGVVGCLAVATLGGVSLAKYRVLPSPQEYPEVYKWIKNQPGEIVLELPRGIEALEHRRMFYSIWTGKTLINGSSGFNPPEIEIKPDYIIVHLDEMQDTNSKIQTIGGHVVYTDENAVVYKL